MRPFLALALALGPGCYLSHAIGPADAGPDARRRDASLDAPVVRDVPGAPDARIEGQYWVVVEGSLFELLHERCELREGASPILHVRTVLPLCDEPGNVRWSVDHAVRRITLSPFVWRPLGIPPCPPATRTFEIDVSLVGETLEAGPWEAVLEDGSARVAFTVAGPPPELACTDCLAEDAACAIDMECAGPLRCVPMRGDAVCASFCVLPCTPFPRREPGDPAPSDLGCQAALGVAATCEDDATLGSRCRAASRDLCLPCPDGMLCSEGDALTTCRWDLELAFGVPEPCLSDADCRPGQSCIEDAGIRSCEVRCRSDHPCPDGTCGPTSVTCQRIKI
jgi:hypothetical protein